MSKCKWHACNNSPNYGTSKQFCSKNCKNKYHVDHRRKELKIKALEVKGNKCERCGWNENPRGLVFHHLDPSKKEFGIGFKGYTRSWNVVLEEINKCALLCHNCHMVIHATNDPKWFKTDNSEILDNLNIKT